MPQMNPMNWNFIYLYLWSMLFFTLMFLFWFKFPSLFSLTSENGVGEKKNNNPYLKW